MVSTEEFIKEYVKAISEGYAAVFAGAGLSSGSGYANWRELVRPFAEEIKLNVDIENDLVSIVQYYSNEHGNRASINQKILNEFTNDAKHNENIEILTRLPIQTYWTTNYDELLEESLKHNNRKIDIKITQNSLGTNIYDRDAIVYKMHGDIRSPSEAVIIKDDYEIFENKRPLFRTALQGDLISKTFLFIGFSFEDPNLDFILRRIRLLLGESVRDHYCFFVKPEKIEGDDDSNYAYKLAKQELRVKDLKRYGIQAIILNNYSNITDVLKKIEDKYLLRNIFISGSIAKYNDPWDVKSVNSFIYKLAKQLVVKDFRIISGFGYGVGSTVLNGALDEIFSSKYKHIDEYLSLRPFPRDSSEDKLTNRNWEKYREEMVSQAGVVIFIFGNKVINNNEVIADGMIEEFRIAKEKGKYVIPVGSTGGAALEIMNIVKHNIDTYTYLKDYLDKLEKDTNGDNLVRIINEIVIKIKNQ